VLPVVAVSVSLVRVDVVFVRVVMLVTLEVTTVLEVAETLERVTEELLV